MHDHIRRLLAWARATVQPDTVDSTRHTFRATSAQQASTSKPSAPAVPVRPRRQELPVSSGSEPGPMLWVTAHGIDVRTRQPHGRGVGR